jgi:hypothetical protein
MIVTEGGEVLLQPTLLKFINKISLNLKNTTLNQPTANISTSHPFLTPHQPQQPHPTPPTSLQHTATANAAPHPRSNTTPTTYSTSQAPRPCQVAPSRQGVEARLQLLQLPHPEAGIQSDYSTYNETMHTIAAYATLDPDTKSLHTQPRPIVPTGPIGVYTPPHAPGRGTWIPTTLTQTYPQLIPEQLNEHDPLYCTCFAWEVANWVVSAASNASHFQLISCPPHMPIALAEILLALRRNNALATADMSHPDNKPGFGSEELDLIFCVLAGHPTMHTLSLNGHDRSMDDVNHTTWVNVGDLLTIPSALAHLNLSSMHMGITNLTLVTQAARHLATLNLSTNSLGDNAGRALATLIVTSSALETLNLAHNRLGQCTVRDISEALAINSTLKALDLSSNYFNAECSPPLANMLTLNHGLVALYLGHNLLGITVHELAEALTANTTLRTLHIGHLLDPHQVQWDAFLPPLAINTHLIDIDLEGSDVGGNEALLAQLLCGSIAHTLSLKSCILSDTTEGQLASAIALNSTLTTLVLASNDLSEVGIGILQAIEINRVLKTVDLTDCSMDTHDLGMATVCVLTHNTTLQHLLMEGNQLGGREIVIMMADVLWQHNTSLTALTLDREPNISAVHSIINAALAHNREWQRAQEPRIQSTIAALPISGKRAVMVILLAAKRFEIHLPEDVWTYGIIPHFNRDDFGYHPLNHAVLEDITLEATVDMAIETVILETVATLAVEATREIQHAQQAIRTVAHIQLRAAATGPPFNSPVTHHPCLAPARLSPTPPWPDGPTSDGRFGEQRDIPGTPMKASSGTNDPWHSAPRFLSEGDWTATTMDLNRCTLQPQDVADLATHMACNNSVCELNLNTCDLTDQAIRTIANAIGSNPTSPLDTLRVNHNSVSVLAAAAIAALLTASHTRVNVLTLESVGLGDSGCCTAPRTGIQLPSRPRK